jgi:hypothetical protein
LDARGVCVFAIPMAILFEYVAMLPDAPHPSYGALSWDAWAASQDTTELEKPSTNDGGN